MNSSDKVEKKKSTRKGESYKKYCYLGSSSEIPLRTKQYWATNKRKRSVEEHNLQCTPSKSATEDIGSNDIKSCLAQVTESIGSSNINHTANSPTQAQNNEDSNESTERNRSQAHSNEDSNESTERNRSQAHSNEDSNESTKISSQQTIDSVAVQNSSHNSNLTLCSSSQTSCDATIVHKSLYSEYSTDDLIAALIFLTIKLRHNLTYAATEDFVRGMSVLNDSMMVKGTKYHWKKIVNSLSDPISIHHLCPKCGSYIGEQKQVEYFSSHEEETSDSDCIDSAQKENEILHCDNCDEDINVETNYQSGSIFLYFSLTYQLQEMFGNSHFHQELEHRNVKENSFAFEDIHDGKLYKNTVDSNMISITFNTDGVPIFDSSDCAAYPILCSVNELSPLKRKKHILLVALWVGSGRPESLQQFFKPFVAEADNLYHKGFTYNYKGQEYTKKCSVVLSINDALVRPKLRNSIQFNGKYGCGLCLNAGKRVKKGQGSVNIFPIESKNPYGEGLRTHTETVKHAKLQDKGIKGESVLSEIPKFDIILGIDVDWMHCVALGVCRQFARLWFDTKNHEEDFYLGEYINEVDALLLSFKPTMDVSRTTREMSDRAHWKAHEWVVFLLVYSLPILQIVAKKKYLKHWALLVDAISLLVQSSIMPSDIYYAHNCFIEFINGVEELYGEEELSFNVHSLAHLAQSVKNWGPLWAHDAFNFENFNQEILAFVKSSNGVAHQIYDGFRTKCVVAKLNNILSEDLSFSQRKFIQKMTENGTKLKYNRIVDNVKLLGEPRILNLTREQFLAFKRRHICIEYNSTVQHYDRAVIKNQILHSNSYQKCIKRNNRCVKLSNNEIFEIVSFVVMDILNETQCYVIGYHFEKLKQPFIPGRKLTHMCMVKNKQDCLGVVHSSEIIERVTILPIQDSTNSVACVYPRRLGLLN